jgi:hypothetical protein
VTFGASAAVPAAGTRQLFCVGQTTSAWRLPRRGRITAGAIQVNVVDAARAYKLSIQINGVEVALVALPVGTLGAQDDVLNVAVVAGDLLTALVILTAGVGGSTFASEVASVEIQY